MPILPSAAACWPRQATGRLVALLLVAGLAAGVPTAFATSPARAATSCDAGSDTCVVLDTVQTALGPVIVTVTSGNVVTVQLTPVAPSTLAFGIPFAIPPGPPGLPGYARTSIATAGGVVDIDAFLTPPGPLSRFALPSVAVISIHPPSPCSVRTSGTTVVFTPLVPPAPPN